MIAKRDDSATVLLSEDDGDNDDDDTDDTPNADASGISNDGTGSRITAVSQDRDISNDDLTKDWTRDGGDLTRDFSQNHTNDASRNDTR